MFKKFDFGSVTPTSAIMAVIPGLERSLKRGCPFQIARASFRVKVIRLKDFRFAKTAEGIQMNASAVLGAPFEGTVEDLELKYNGETGRYLVRFTSPVPFSRLIREHVLPKHTSADCDLLERLLMPLTKGMDRPRINIANGSVSFDGTSYPPGIAFEQKIAAGHLESFSSLCGAFPKLEPKSNVAVALHFKVGANLGFEANVTWLPQCQMGSILLEKVVLESNHKTSSLIASIRVSFSMDVGETLNFHGSLINGRPMAIQGMMQAADGWWDQPCGVQGLRIKQLEITVSGLAKEPHTIVSFKGRAFARNLELDGHFRLLLPSPKNPVLVASSKQSYSLAQLAGALTSPRIKTGKLARIRLVEPQLTAAREAVVVADESYEEGLKLETDIELHRITGKISGRLDYEKGGLFRGHADPIHFVKGKKTLMSFTGITGEPGPGMEIELGPDLQRARIQGRFTFLEAVTSTMNVELSSKGFRAVIREEAFGIFKDRILVWEQGVFTLQTEVRKTVEVKLFGQKFTFSARAVITLTGSEEGISQNIKWSAKLMGKMLATGTVNIDFPFLDQSVVGDHFNPSAFADILKEHARDPDEKAIAWFRNNCGKRVRKASTFFRKAGADRHKLARLLARVYKCKLSKAVSHLADSREEKKSMLAALGDDE